MCTFRQVTTTAVVGFFEKQLKLASVCLILRSLDNVTALKITLQKF